MIWTPELPAADARWLALARTLAQQPEGADATALLDSGLLAMLAPRRQGGGMQASWAAWVCVFETLAASHPRLCAGLAGALAGAWPIARLGDAGQKKAWLTEGLAHQAFPMLLCTPSGEADGAPAFVATPEAKGWRLRGQGQGLSTDLTTGVAVVFAARASGTSSGRVFSVPLNTPGIAIDANASQATFTLNLHLPHDAVLGSASATPAVHEEVQALRRLVAAAQSLSCAITAHAEARRALQAAPAIVASPAPSPSRAARQLAPCTAALSAARMMVYEAARAAQAGQDVGLLSAMAQLTARACCEQTLATSLQLAGGQPLADFARLHALMHARQIHEAGADPAETQWALLANALVPAAHRSAPLRTPTAPIVQGAARTMSRPPAPSNGNGEPASRVAEILDAAAAAFTQQSYDATTLDYIGDAIGVTKGSIYYHYRSKAELFVAVYRRAMEMNIATLTPIAQQTGVRAIDRLYCMVYAHALQVMRHLAYQRVAVQGLEAHLMNRVNAAERAQLNEVIALRDRYEALFLATIDEAIGAGELPAQDAHMAVKPLFGATNAITLWYRARAGETATDRERIAGYLARVVVSGLQLSYVPALEGLPEALAPVFSDTTATR